MLNTKTKEFVCTQISVPKQLVINVSDPEVELLKDNDWSVTPSSYKYLPGRQRPQFLFDINIDEGLYQ